MIDPQPDANARAANSAHADELSSLLRRWSQGERAALDALMPLVYKELRRLAEHHMRGERAHHTMQPTALVHEAYIGLAQQHQLDVRCRAQFFGLASSIMRHILVDHARAKRAAKRGSGAELQSLDDTGAYPLGFDSVAAAVSSPDEAVDLIALDASLQRLEQLDARQAQVVEMRFFMGMSVEETAEAMALSCTTVKREWATARAWLLRDLALSGLGA